MSMRLSVSSSFTAYKSSPGVGPGTGGSAVLQDGARGHTSL